jgi:carboxypeptidase Q
MTRRLITALVIRALYLRFRFRQTVQSQHGAASRLIGDVSANGQQMWWLQMLSDEIGSRLTGSPGCRRAEELMEAEMKRIGLANVHRET